MRKDIKNFSDDGWKYILAKDLLPGATATYGTTFGYTLTKFSEFVRQVDQNLTYYPTYPSK
nr:hypothetical protein [Eubacterium sp.]